MISAFNTRFCLGRKTFRQMILLFLVFSVSASLAHAADLYVGKTNCTDSGSGTLLRPFCTIQKAADTARAGDTVNVLAGTYPEKITLRNSGNSSAYITFRNYNNDIVNLDPGSFYGSGVSYLKIIGFRIKNPPDRQSAIRFYGKATNIEIRNNNISGADTTTSGVIEIGGFVKNFIIDNNHVHHCKTGNAEAIKVFESASDFKITNNLVEYNTNIGIVVNGWAKWGKPKNGLIKGNLVRYNSIQAPYSAGIYLDCTNDMIIENNTAYGNIRGFQIGCEEPGDISENNIMRNNVAYENTGSGMQVGGYQGGITRYNKIYNNVFYDNAKDELAFDTTPGYNNEFYNNIFYDPGTNLIWGQGPDNKFDHNVYFDGGGPGSNNSINDPLFVDAAKRDFRLKSTSPACIAGRDGKYAGAFPCTSIAVCGDGACNGNENCTTCSKDCGVCAPVCGDGACNGKENCTTCSKDCGTCPVNVPVCGDGACNGKENCTTCSKDCGVCAPVCGDGSCNGIESCSTCEADCGRCRSSGGSSSGRSSGSSKVSCTERWECTDWGECLFDVKRRSCLDLNSCGTENKKPSEEMDCISEVTEDLTAEEESPEEEIVPSSQSVDSELMHATPEISVVKEPVIHSEMAASPAENRKMKSVWILSFIVLAGISAFIYLRPAGSNALIKDPYLDLKHLINVARQNGYDDRYIRKFLITHGLDDAVVKSLVTEISVVNTKVKRTGISEWHGYFIENLKLGVSLEEIEKHLISYGYDSNVVEFLISDFKDSFGLK